MRIPFITLALATTLLPLSAQAQRCPMGFTEMTRAPEARNWQERDTQLLGAKAITLTALVHPKGKNAQRVEFVRSQAGTVACVRHQDGSCSNLVGLGFQNLNIGLMLDLLLGRVAPGDRPEAVNGAGGHWALPAEATTEGTQAWFSRWAFNPEAGMPMPGVVLIEQDGHTATFEVERFKLEREYSAVE